MQYFIQIFHFINETILEEDFQPRNEIIVLSATARKQFDVH